MQGTSGSGRFANTARDSVENPEESLPNTGNRFAASQTSMASAASSTSISSIPEDNGNELTAPENHGPLPRFELLVHLFEALEMCKGKGSTFTRRRIVTEFIHDWRKKVGNNIYPAFQLILPHIDRDMNQLFKIKEKALARILLPALGVPKDSDDAKALLAPTTGGKRWSHNSKYNGLGFSAVAFDLVDKRNPRREYSDFGIGEVALELKKLADAKKDQQIDIMRAFYQQMNPLELKWILRIIVRNLQINASERTILEIWHPDALALYNVSHDLKMALYATTDPRSALGENQKAIKPLLCFKPQRSRFIKGVIDDFNKVCIEMKTEIRRELQKSIDPEDFHFYIEEKIDGERMQLHWTQGGKVCKYFSRKGTDYTADYGPSILSDQGSLTPHLKSLLAANVDSCILDGEMVAWDAVHKEVCALTKVKEAAQGGGQWQPMLIIFDCVHLNGKNLCNYSLSVRKQVLDKVIPIGNRSQGAGHLEILQYQKGRTALDVEEAFKDVISRMSEGLVVKSPFSKYTVNGDKFAWLKVKPEFVSGYEDDNFDLVVVGAYYGSGKYTNQLCSFLMSIRDDRKKPRYLSLCRVSNGFCTAMYDRIARETEGQWISNNQPPPSVSRIGEDIPHLWLDPEKTGLVFEVKATQIVPSVRYSSGFSLRFPRFVRFKPDRDGSNCLSLKEFESYRESISHGGSAKRPSSAVAPQSTAKLASRKKLRLQSPVVQESLIEKNSYIFSELTFYVAGDIKVPEYATQGELEKMIKQFGGNISRTIAPGATIVADARLPRIMKIYDENRISIVHPRWIFDCISANRRLPLEPDHYLKCATRAEIHDATKLIDQFGFSLFRKQSKEDVSRHLKAMDISKEYSKEQKIVARKALARAIDEDHSCRPASRAWLFCEMRVYSIIPTKRNIQLLLRFGGASIVDDMCDATHVLCDDRGQWGQIRRPRGCHIITSSWVSDCWREISLLDEEQHPYGVSI